MDVIDDLDGIFKLIFKGDHFYFKNNEELENFRAKAVDISDNLNNADRTHIERVLTSTELLLKIFLSNYEEKFNIFIEYILQRVQNLIKCAGCDFTRDFINIADLCVEITVTNPSDTNIVTLSDFYKCNINEIKIKSNADLDGTTLIEELTVRLRIISVIYEKIYNLKQDDRHCAQQVVKYMMHDNDESELFRKLVCKHSETLMIPTLIDIIPKFINITNNYNVLHLIWEEICDMGDNSRMFIIFCYLSDYYFAADNKHMMSDIFADSTYWIMLQNGLINRDSACRKQALFLMKESLDYIIVNNISFYCYTKEVLADGERMTRKLPLIYWGVGMKFEELKELCVIVEYLEEKQGHIVKPIFSRIENFLKNVEEEKMDASWVLIMIERMVSHDNMKIVRQGISNLVKINVNAYHEECTMRKAIKLLLTSLNCTKIYMFELASLLEELKTYFETCSVQENGKQFFRILIREMCDIQWSSEAVFSIAYSLQLIKLKKYWQAEEINLIKKLITTGTANHYTYIKSGMLCHLLLAGINLIDTCSVSLEDIDGLLNCYQRKISLQRKTLLWECVVKWIRNFCAVEDAQNFIISALGKRNIGRMMVLLYDSYADDEMFLQEMKNLMKKISETFVGIHARPYCDKKVQESYLAIICDIIGESSGDLEFWNIFCPFISDIVSYIKLQLESIQHIRDYQLSKVLMKYLKTLLQHDRKHLILPNMVNKWFDETVTDLVSKDDTKRGLPLQEFIKIRLLNMMMDYTTCDTRPIESYLRGELNSSLIRTTEDLTMTKDLQTLWGRMNSEYLHGKWELLSKMDGSPTRVLHVSNEEFVSRCFEALDLTGSIVLVPLMTVLGKALPSLLDESGVEELIDAVWRIVMERKKNEEFQSLIKHFVEAVFQLEVIQTGNDDVRRLLLEYSRRILSENTTTPAAILLKHVQSIGYHEEGTYFFEDLLPRALLFGQILRKDERLIREVCTIIETSGLSPLINDFSSSNEVRARSNQIILTLNPREESDSRFSERLAETLVSLEESSISKNKTRYFYDSHVHRVKQRLLQTLLILEPYMTKAGSETLWKWLSDKILLENNQPSVRHLQEWLMVRILHRNPHFRDEFWTYFDESLEKRTGSLCSLISIIYHSLKCIPRDETADFIEKALMTFLPYCMAQHFSVRLYAQVTLEKLLKKAEELGLEAITGKYDIVMKSLKQSIERGNAVKNCAKMQEDFYFTVFDPIEHYSLRTIFFELPRLTNVNQDELIAEDLFRECGVVGEECVVPLGNANDSLANVTSGKWIVDGSKQDNFIEDAEDREDSGNCNFQKKMIPVKSLIPDRTELLQSVSFSNKKIEKDGLVVVASLIDRIPNLGGLSRTCEVFGASELVIGSLKYAEDKQFQSLSVTAEKWITITEVKPFYLSDYLIKMKRMGYTVLAAEQTINSQSLQSVKFPKKSLLLLGNEKEGIPPTLLPLMDICIEIPQIGVIRSLNVHVTGALFIWEYSKQHHFS